MKNKETLELVTNAAKSKIGLLKESKGKYFLSAFLAGMFIGIGILLAFTVGGVSSSLPTNKILMGFWDCVKSCCYIRNRLIYGEQSGWGSWISE